MLNDFQVYQKAAQNGVYPAEKGLNSSCQMVTQVYKLTMNSRAL